MSTDSNAAQNAPEHAKQAPARERQSVQWLLRGGLFISGILLTLGLLLELFRGELSPRAFDLSELMHGQSPMGERLMGLGILVLSMTPAVRVVALLVLWTQERDWKFVTVALAVIATLGAAIALGGG